MERDLRQAISSKILDLKVTEDFVRVGELDLHYLQWGNGSETILALHGVSSLARAWSIIGESLANEYKFIALDQRGHGDSSKPKDGYTVDDYNRDILAFVDGLFLQKFILLGHSMGGRNAIVFTAEHPKRVSKLIVEDFGYGIPRNVYHAIETLVLSNPEEFASETEVYEYLRARSQFYQDDAIWNRIRNAFFKTETGLRWKYDRNAMVKTLENLYVDLPPYLEAIRCPTLFIRGIRSTIFTRDAALRTLEFNKNFELDEVNDSTHFLQDENPAELLEKIRRFLKK